jgi:hypothetical protein
MKTTTTTIITTTTTPIPTKTRGDEDDETWI